MYFLTAVACTLISGCIFFFNRSRKKLHLEILTIIYGAASIMWLVDCFSSLAKGEGFLSMDFPTDGYIALWTVIGGLFLWLIIAFVLNNLEKEDKNL